MRVSHISSRSAVCSPRRCLLTSRATVQNVLRCLHHMIQVVRSNLHNERDKQSTPLLLPISLSGRCCLVDLATCCSMLLVCHLMEMIIACVGSRLGMGASFFPVPLPSILFTSSSSFSSSLVVLLLLPSSLSCFLPLLPWFPFFFLLLPHIHGEQFPKLRKDILDKSQRNNTLESLVFAVNVFGRSGSRSIQRGPLHRKWHPKTADHTNVWWRLGCAIAARLTSELTIEQAEMLFNFTSGEMSKAQAKQWTRSNPEDEDFGNRNSPCGPRNPAADVAFRR